MIISEPLEPRPNGVSRENGRVVAWHEYGCLDNPRTTVLYCHGTPGSGYEAVFFDEAARQLGIRIIALDRPGLGASDTVDSRTVDSWVSEDVATVLQHLGLERVSVLGFSGGSPHAMGIASRMPAVVERLILLAPFTHHRAWGTRLVLAMMPLRVRASRALLRLVPKALINHVVQCVGAKFKDRSTLVRALARDVQGRTAAVRMVVAHEFALGRTVAGGIQDEYVIHNRWGFPEATVRVPADVWVAGMDKVVKPSRARNLGLRLGATIHDLPGDGHFSLLMNHAQEILGTVLGTKPGRDIAS